MRALPDFRLDGKVAVVTGASSGLGVYFAGVLAAAGADVVIGARRVEALTQTRDAVLAAGRRCIAVPTDVAQVADCDALIDAAVTELGGVHVLVNNAGLGYAVRAERDDPQRAAALLQVNLMGAYQMALAAGRAMIAAGAGGSIINIASAMGIAPGAIPQASYSASKSGLLGLTRDLAGQWARHTIRVNALAPGFFESEITAPLLTREEGMAAVLERTPLNRIGRLDELGGPLLLLASDAGSYLTGITLAVDGGWTRH